MKLNRWTVLPLVALAAILIGVAAVEAAPSPSPSTTSSKNYVQVFVDKLAGILHLTPTQTRDAIKQAELQTVDQMLADGQITKAQADALKAKINAGQGLGPVGGFGLKRPGLFGDRTLMRDLASAELNAVASALHMSTSDLQSALRSGKRLSDLEAQQKVSDSAVKSAVKNAAKGVLDKAVKAGTITQAQEDQMLTKIGSGKFGLGKGMPHRPGPKASPTPGATPAAFFSTI